MELEREHPTSSEELSEKKDISSNTSSGAENEASSGSPKLTGSKLGILTTGLSLCFFLSALDITIVSTSLTGISNDLNAYDKGSWIVSSYLTTYFSFLVIWAKLSDIIGRKITLMGAIIVFLAFSAGCGGSQTAIQLIVCRAFQGIGGAGIFSMVPIIVAEMVDPEKYGAYNGIVSSAIALSFLLGPLVGGAIVDGTTWRWIFWINLPVGAVALAFVFLGMPAGFPDVTSIDSSKAFGLVKPNMQMRNRIDYPGFIILLAACVLLIVAIEEAGISYGWDSALVISCLVIAGVLFIAFFAWEWYTDYSKSQREPIFPWEFVKTRVLMGIYLNALLSGVPFVTLVLELPLRFMSVNDKSGLHAGIYILPFTLSLGVGSAIVGFFTSGGRVPMIVVLFMASVLQILGVGLLYSIPVNTDLPARLYGFQILAGFGTGFSLTTLITAIPFIANRRVLAVAMGGMTQMRILGGALGTAIATNLLNNTAKDMLASELPANTLDSLLKDVSLIKTLTLNEQGLVRDAFAEGFHKQLVMILGFCAAEVIALALIWEWPMRRFK